MAEVTKNLPHNIIMENREKTAISGVIDVGSLDESVIVIKTVMGDLTVKGSGLKIISFSGDTGDLVMSGTVFAMGYTDKNSAKGKTLSRMFK